MLRFTLCCATAALLALSASAQVEEVRETEFDRRATIDTKNLKSIDEAFKAETSGSIDAVILKAEVPEGRERLEKDPVDPKAEMIDSPEDKPLPLPVMNEELEKLELTQTGDSKPPRVTPPPKDPKMAFVQSIWLEGLPLAEAKKYANASDPYFRRVLADPSMEAYHSNVLGILGMSGANEAEEIILSYILKGSGNISDGSFSARTDGILALGYLANTSEGKAGLKPLLETAGQESWSALGIDWAFQPARTREELMDMLRASSLIGLALSGRPEAAEAFADARKSIGASRSASAITAADLEDYMRAYEQVRSQGLVAYSSDKD